MHKRAIVHDYSFTEFGKPRGSAIKTVRGKAFNKFSGFCLLFFILMVTGCGEGSPPDTTPPSNITDIQHVFGTRGSITWTAPGDDGDDGTASKYDVRISNQSIDSDSDFEGATSVPNVPTPNLQGTTEQLTIPGLDIGKTYFVAIKTTDSDGNQSALSTSFSFTSSLQPVVERNGINSGDLLGQSVGKAGDINGDGIPDIVVGIPSTGILGQGSINIYFGGSIINSSPDIILESLQTGDQFGFSVAGIGDVNGDGCSDIGVGAYLYSGNTLSKNGAVFIYFGSGGGLCPGGIDQNSSPNFSPNVIIQGISNNDGFGYALTAIGDVNNDLISDFMVGAPFVDSNRGNSFIFYGSDSISSSLMASQADIILAGEFVEARFGFSMDGEGDLDGDQVPDIVIGANQQDSTTEAGVGYVFFGSTLLTLSGNGSALDADIKFSGIFFNDRMGWSITMTEDLSGDNNSDVVVATPFRNSNQGEVYVFYSDSPTGFTSKSASLADATLSGVSSNDRFGWSVADVGDLDLDGFSDLIVGAPQQFPDAGSAYVFYGGSTLFGNISAGDPEVLSFQGENPLDLFGTSVAGIGDTNGDGYDEFIVGAPRNGPITNGAVYIFR